MLKRAGATLLLGTTLMGVGCAYNRDHTDLRGVAEATGLNTITTGDGEFGEYAVTGQYKGTEWGLAFGLPFLFKGWEILPWGQSNEDLLARIADDASTDGANNMINTRPHKHTYTGIPFIILGIYKDKSEGTGIHAK